uniref:Uncharacterized protein n=1 Tax=Siphoviridae sp. ctLqe90 TaxID=2825456 RepID=A0A8S5Q418_9CAUD|nr:MAG TPA: hypothetical protein [Siphoviridae sp. ctLqe90]
MFPLFFVKNFIIHYSISSFLISSSIFFIL